MILLSILLVLSLVTTGLYVYFFEYLKGNVLYYTIPIAYLVSFIGFFILFILFLVICLLFRPKNKKPTKFFAFFTTQVALIVTFVSRVKVVLEGLDKLPKDGKFLLISNHQSLQDPIAVIGHLRKYNMTYIMKDSIMKIPLVGKWLKAAGFYPLDRKNDRNALKTIIEAIQRLKDGYPVAAFPEGTRSGSAKINEFRNGIFKIPQKAEAPIVVCLVDNFYAVKNRYPFKRTKTIIKVCDVIAYDEIKDLHTNEIGDKCLQILLENQKIIREKYNWIE